MVKRKSGLRLGDRTMLLDYFLAEEKNDNYAEIAAFFRKEGYSPDCEISERDFREVREDFREIYGF